MPKKQELLRVTPVEYTRLGVNETLSLLKQKFLQHKTGEESAHEKGLVTGATITWGESDRSVSVSSG